MAIMPAAYRDEILHGGEGLFALAPDEEYLRFKRLFVDLAYVEPGAEARHRGGQYRRGKPCLCPEI